MKCFEDNSKVREQLSKPGRGKVLVVDAGGSTHCAMAGDILAGIGIKNNWSGIILHGMIRDSYQIEQMPIGVMALGKHPKKSERNNIGEIDLPVSVAGVTFHPGDFVYADYDGIVNSNCELTYK